MAYNRTYQYETSPRKLEPSSEPIRKTYPKKSTARRTKKKQDIRINKAMQIKIICYIIIGFTGLFVISYRYSMIDNTYASLTSRKSELESIKKETAQLEANIESNINLTKIEEEAKEQLGMKKLSPEQTVYVTLPKTDHVDVSSEEIKASEKSNNWISEIINKIINSFK